ncbi:PhoH family protein [Ferroacidibacillus organovorans]|uniref:PhoH-like protein n=1 Tax=Ferroacidibacillus organovorans TaxID=1765683 RepID=A0A117SYT0_9BACL|nr:PhoH family protein [Ferroacidibacillus organovorans]KUO97401.1 phosphate starvation-inducible protein PhoH [Ferroacidibacillus organovorans]
MSEASVTSSRKIVLRDNEEARAILGPHDAHLRALDQAFSCQVISRGNEITLTGKESDVAELGELFDVLTTLSHKGYGLTERDIAYAITLSKTGQVRALLEMYTEEIAQTFRGKSIRIKTLGQRRYVDAIRKHDIVFGIGPAGTGKTYMAVVLAFLSLKRSEVKRIILTRPAVEAGENLGFLPGDLQEKVDPYLRPLYDALHDVMGPEQLARSMERGLVEVAPLAYMRGRTLDEAFVILDEAQNTTPEQMKMFLTRLGHNAKMVITGDVTQIDLPRGKRSGLKEAARILGSIDEISFIELDEADVVRHPLVQRIIRAYAEEDEADHG